MSLPTTLPVLFWLDSTDNATLTLGTNNELTSWASKEGGLVATATASDFGTNMSQIPGTAGGSWIQLYMSGRGRTLFLMPEDQIADDILRSDDYGNTWQPTLQTLNTRLNEIKMSDTGQYMIATGDEDYLYTSSDYGATFTPHFTDAPRAWEWCAVSSDGKYMLASNFGEGTVRSSDFGATFQNVPALPTTPTDLGLLFISQAGDGARQYAGYFGGQLFTSTDYGVTWLAVAGMPVQSWFDMVESGDGNTLVAWSNLGTIYISRNAGTTWDDAFPGAPAREWIQVRISNDGTTMAAIEDNGLFYISKDAGVTWTEAIDTTPRNWTDVAVSPDGNYVAAGADRLYISTDGGTTFAPIGNPGTRFTVEISRNNSVLLYTSYGDGAYIAYNATPFVRTLGGRQYVSFERSQMDVTGFDLGTGFTVMAVFVPQDSKRGALWSFDATHGFYPRDGNDTVLQYGAAPVYAAGIPLDTLQVFTTVVEGGNVQMFGNNSKLADTAYTATSDGTTMRMGYDADNNFFDGLVGEIVVYDGRLSTADRNQAMTYFANKWNIPAAYPVVAGVGSDPHLMCIDGRRFDIMQPGWYTLLQVNDLQVTFKVVHLKMENGLYIDRFRVVNGPYTAKIAFKGRALSLTMDYESPVHMLERDETDFIKWDIYPKAPQRLVKVLHGYNMAIGHFWLYVDYKHRYITPYLPQIKDWSNVRGLLSNPETAKPSQIAVNHRRPMQRVR